VAGSKLSNDVKGEILELVNKGESQAQIIRRFRQQGINIARSTLSDFVRKQQEVDIATTVQDDEETAERFEAGLHFQRSTADELIDRQADVIEGIQQLKQEGDERHSALLKALVNIRVDAPDSAEVRRMLDAAITRLDSLASRTTGAALRWVWLKALGITGVCWGVMLAAVALLL
jgi:hypothetical protein